MSVRVGQKQVHHEQNDSHEPRLLTDFREPLGARLLIEEKFKIITPQTKCCGKKQRQSKGEKKILRMSFPLPACSMSSKIGF